VSLGKTHYILSSLIEVGLVKADNRSLIWVVRLNWWSVSLEPDNGFYRHHEGSLKILTYMTLID